MNFEGKAKRLDDVDLPRIGQMIGVGEDEIHAVLEVETRGGGFDSQGRPKMLFEPHIFYRLLGPGPRRDEAVQRGLAYQRWGSQPYPRESYSRLAIAMAIDEDLALQSASWGLGQIMGFNANAAGYPSAKAMVEDFLDDEEKHLEAMIKFIKTNGLDDELRRHDWKGFARGYNGPGYAKHGYHLKLMSAYRKWKKIPDTPFNGDFVDAVAPVETTQRFETVPSGYPTLRMGNQGGHVRILQEDLTDLGYSIGRIDGQFGPNVRRAVVAFQIDNDLVADGIVGNATWSAMSSSAKKAERDVNMDDLRDGGSTTVAAADTGQKVVGVGAAATAAVTAMDALTSAGSSLSGAETALETAQNALFEYWPVLAVALVGFLLWQAFTKIKSSRLRDAQTGKHMGR